MRFCAPRDQGVKPSGVVTGSDVSFIEQIGGRSHRDVPESEQAVRDCWLRSYFQNSAAWLLNVTTYYTANSRLCPASQAGFLTIEQLLPLTSGHSFFCSRRQLANDLATTATLPFVCAFVQSNTRQRVYW